MRSLARRSFLVALALVVACDAAPGDDTDPSGTGPTVAAGCIEVPVATAEKFTLLTDLAAEFSATGFEVDGTCVSVTVYRVSSGIAANLLSAGWPADTAEAPPPCCGARPPRVGVRSSARG